VRMRDITATLWHDLEITYI